QAEDGIRDLIVTGVQTCALPICCSAAESCFWQEQTIAEEMSIDRTKSLFISGVNCNWSSVIRTKKTEGQEVVKRTLTRLRRWCRSEERRVGKECRARGGTDNEEK